MRSPLNALPRPKGRGPIEAWPSNSSAHRFSTFRGRKVAAPLKLIDQNRTWFTATTFRGRKVAAPLKPFFARLAVLVYARLPRPKGRGPIEARTI